MNINDYLELISNKDFKIWIEENELVWKSKGKKENWKILNNDMIKDFDFVKRQALYIKDKEYWNK